MPCFTNSDLQAIHDSVANFVKTTLNPVLRDGEKKPVIASCWRYCGESGLLGAHIDSEYGGEGASVLAAVIAMESLGEHCVDNGVAFAVNATLFSHASTIAGSANSELKKRYLRPLCAGELICAYALTEENTGSDAYALETKAEKVADGYILNGVKTYITLGPIADFAIVFATTNPVHKQWGLIAFLVDLNVKGVTRESIKKPGFKTAPMGKLSFNDCFVPEGNILGQEGGGAAVFEESQMWERSFVMASQVGVMKRQLDNVIAYCNERKQFGKSIGKFQSVSNRVADMRLRLETSQLILHNVARIKDSGKSVRLESALLKIHLSESFLENSLDAVRIQGAKGYTGEAEAFTNLADSVAGLMMAGTNDIQRGIISRLLGV